ncbi:uncharacterized protein LOC123884902 [Trifolium pratense]|uniref:uncharacterized protein LOC123884902 n=1 Tax=Trifolium pratense TaxID=57577 RepID=UPI001E691F73|nr:uncharacterized protein LOC123884902 [Trifolium pratense]
MTLKISSLKETRRSKRIKSMQKCSYCDSNSKSHDHANKNMNKNLNNTKSCKVISKLLLPEDLMIDIFTLVPLTFLINSAKYVCKSWANTLGNSHFAAAFECRGHSKFGLYVENRMSRSSSYFLEFKDDVNGQFERTNLGTPKKMGYAIGTCDGLLLLWDGYMQTYVVNPLLKCWLRIPPFPGSRKYYHLVVIVL